MKNELKYFLLKLFLFIISLLEIFAYTPEAICNSIPGLSARQVDLCSAYPSFMSGVAEATDISLRECQFQFRFRPWNCSSSSFASPSQIFFYSPLQGSREMAFLDALYAASLSHVISRRCSEGAEERCSCSNKHPKHMNQRHPRSPTQIDPLTRPRHAMKEYPLKRLDKDTQTRKESLINKNGYIQELYLTPEKNHLSVHHSKNYVEPLTQQFFLNRQKNHIHSRSIYQLKTPTFNSPQTIAPSFFPLTHRYNIYTHSKVEKATEFVNHWSVNSFGQTAISNTIWKGSFNFVEKSIDKGHKNSIENTFIKTPFLNEISPPLPIDSNPFKNAWEWKGCAANIDFGMEFSRNFVDEGKPESTFVLLKRHNSRAGRKVLRQLMNHHCRCTGASGSCATRSCWTSVPSLRRLSDRLYLAFEAARRVEPTSSASHGRRTNRNTDNNPYKPIKKLVLKFKRSSSAHKNLKPSPTDFVYTKPSPNFCNSTQYFPSNAGRVCLQGSQWDFDKKGSSNGLRRKDACPDVCCGRGFDVVVKKKTTKCGCRFVWCCRVECDLCLEKIVEYICR